MPSGKYEVTRIQNETASREQSYRNCVITILIFVILCLLLYFTSWAWKNSSNSEDVSFIKSESIDKASEQYRIVTGSPQTSKKYSKELEDIETITEGWNTGEKTKDKKLSQEYLERLEIFSTDFTTPATPESILSTISLKETHIHDLNDQMQTSSTNYDFNYQNYYDPSSFPSLTSSAYDNLQPFTSLFHQSTPFNKDENDDDKDYDELIFSITSTDYSSTTVYDENDTVSSSTAVDEEVSSTASTIITENNTFLEKLASSSSSTTVSNDDWFETENSRSSTESNPFNIIDYLTTISLSTITTEASTIIPNVDISTISTITSDTTTFSSLIEASTRKKFENSILMKPEEEGLSKRVNDDIINELDDSDNLSAICESGKCKQWTSKMLSYMNHSADPCEDFYEYACGGMEADPQISKRDLSVDVLERIKKSMKEYSTFANYLNSCIKYSEVLTYDQKLEEVKKSVNNIGSFYTLNNWPDNYHYSVIITQLITNIILTNSPFLFDIIPDINEMNPQKFILRIGPVYENYLYPIDPEPCIEDIEKDFNFNNIINVSTLYTNYKSCKSNTEKRLNITKWMDDLHDSFILIRNVISTGGLNINFQILKGYFLNYEAAENKVRKAYSDRNYSIVTLKELQNHTDLINWEQLINHLTGLNVTADTEVQIYFKNEFFNALKALKPTDTSQQVELNNALLGFHAVNLYKKMVQSKVNNNLEEQCLRLAIRMLPHQSSLLYITSFLQNDLDHFNTMLKETLRFKFSRLDWTTEQGHKEFLKKLSAIKLSTPDPSSYNFKNVLQYNVKMTDNFFANTINLMRKYREEMYSFLTYKPSDPRQLWTYFAKPFQTSPQTIYSLNLIIIPFGTINWSSMLRYKKEFDYLIFASIGNLLAREIAHYFDTNGIKYWNGTRDFPFSLIDDELTETTYYDYIHCQQNLLFQEPIKMTIPFTNQQIQFTMPESTLNERLSDIMGIKLAHDTLARVHTSNITKILPWLSLDIHQLFYLAYTQTYCTKTQLADYISLYDKSILPSRIRIFATAINNQDIGQAWKCPEGSQIRPTFSCGVFPDLEYQGGMMESS